MSQTWLSKKGILTCNCKAYSFPHALDGGKCRALYNNENSDSESHAEWSASMLAQFDRTEAQAINANRELLK